MDIEEIVLRAEVLDAAASSKDADSVRWALEAVRLLDLHGETGWRNAVTQEDLCRLLECVYDTPQEPLQG